MTAVYGPVRPLRHSATSSSSAAACSATPKPSRTSSSSAANVSFQPATSRTSATSLQLPEGTAPGSFVSAAAHSASTAKKAHPPTRASSTSSVPKHPPGKKSPPTAVDPRDPLFEPPTEGVVHYFDPAGGVHVIAAPGVSVPSSYSTVDVKTAEQAVAIHGAAQIAAATAAEATEAQARLEARAATSTAAISAVLLSEKERVVLPKSLRTLAEQTLALKTMKALHHQVDAGKKQTLADTQEIKGLLNQVQELYCEKERLADELDLLRDLNTQLSKERADLAQDLHVRTRLELEHPRPQPEASTSLEEALAEVARGAARCEELQEQLSLSSAAAGNAESRAKKAESNMSDAIAAHAVTRASSANLEESNAQLSRQLTGAEHQLQLHQDRIDELTMVEEQLEQLHAEHRQQLAVAEDERLHVEVQWHHALDEAEAKEAVALANAAVAAEACEKHKAQFQEALADVESLEEQLRRFDEVAADAATAAETEHEEHVTRLRQQLEGLQVHLEESSSALRSSDLKLKAAGAKLRTSDADLDAVTKELATAHRGHASELEELTANFNQKQEAHQSVCSSYAARSVELTANNNRLLLLVDQLKESAAAAAADFNQKQEAHQSAHSFYEKQTEQLHASLSSMEAQRATAVEELELLLRESGAYESRLADLQHDLQRASTRREQLEANQVHLEAECAKDRESSRTEYTQLRAECARLREGAA